MPVSRTARGCGNDQCDWKVGCAWGWTYEGLGGVSEGHGTHAGTVAYHEEIDACGDTAYPGVTGALRDPEGEAREEKASGHVGKSRQKKPPSAFRIDCENAGNCKEPV